MICEARSAGARSEVGRRLEALGYPRGLTAAAALRAEGARIEAASILLHMHVMLCAGGHTTMSNELAAAEASLSEFRIRLERLARPIRPIGGPTPNIRNINCRIHGASQSLTRYIRQLQSALPPEGAWRTRKKLRPAQAPVP